MTTALMPPILPTMSSSTSNIEAVARDIYAKQMSRRSRRSANPAFYIDRYWHCVAAELEAGLIDDVGDPIPQYDLDKGLEAYRDWCRRHPESKPVADPA